MNPMRGRGAAAVSASAVAAGIMASSSGSEMAAPTPWSTLRRDKALRVRYMAGLRQFDLVVSRRGASITGARTSVLLNASLLTMPITMDENR